MIERETLKILIQDCKNELKEWKREEEPHLHGYLKGKIDAYNLVLDSMGGA